MKEKEVFNQEYFKQRNVKKQEEYMKRLVTSLIDLVLDNLKIFENITNLQFHIPSDITDWGESQGFYPEK